MSKPITDIAREMIESFSKADFQKMSSLLDNEIVAYITNAESGVDTIYGRDEYIQRVKAMDLAAATFSLEIKQMVQVSETQVLLMVEVQANKNNKSLHNFAAHLLKIKDEKITEWWMVEALPAYSEEFWLK